MTYRPQQHDEENHSFIRWIDDSEGGMVYNDEYEEYLREMEEQIQWEKLTEHYDLGEVITTWKEDGGIEVNYGFYRGRKGTLLTQAVAPELSEEAFSNWDVFLRFRNGQVEVMFGNVEKKIHLPDDAPHYYQSPIEWE